MYSISKNVFCNRRLKKQNTVSKQTGKSSLSKQRLNLGEVAQLWTDKRRAGRRMRARLKILPRVLPEKNCRNTCTP